MPPCPFTYSFYIRLKLCCWVWGGGSCFFMYVTSVEVFGRGRCVILNPLLWDIDHCVPYTKFVTTHLITIHFRLRLGRILKVCISKLN